MSGADIFVVGPARSGTSWLQTVLAEHPDLASPPETHLFVNYLGPLARAWERDRGLIERAARDRAGSVTHGLATVVTDDEFTAMLRSFYATVRALVVSAKPGASRFLEKTPDHALWLDTIWRVAPDAQVVCLVRDPRDTVRSLLDAGREAWGEWWAPASVDEAAAVWRRNVRAILARKRDPRVLVVRYEDLRAEAGELARVAEFLALAAPDEWLKSSLDASPGTRDSTVLRGDAAARQLNPYDASAFSFHDRADRRALTDYEIASVVTTCRDEMQALGYPTDIGRLPPRLQLERARHAVRLRTRGILRVLGQRAPRRR